MRHGQERGDPAEIGAVADAGGNGDDGGGDESADDAGERAFHAGANDHDAGGGQPLAVAQKAVNAGLPDSSALMTPLRRGRSAIALPRAGSLDFAGRT